MQEVHITNREHDWKILTQISEENDCKISDIVFVKCAKAWGTVSNITPVDSIHTVLMTKLQTNSKQNHYNLVYKVESESDCNSCTYMLILCWSSQHCCSNWLTPYRVSRSN